MIITENSWNTNAADRGKLCVQYGEAFVKISEPELRLRREDK
jgi:hypothetical protein